MFIIKIILLLVRELVLFSRSGTSIRLVSGDSTAGRVEVNFLGDWGNVCAKNFGVKEAQVVCQMLGFNT